MEIRWEIIKDREEKSFLIGVNGRKWKIYLKYVKEGAREKKKVKVNKF